MTKYFISFFYFILIISGPSFAQTGFVRTKEGKPILNRKDLIASCLKSLNKEKTDPTALSVCECQVEKIDRRFTNKQYKKYTNERIIDISGLIKEDSLVDGEVQNCMKSTGKSILMHAEGFKDDFISNCIKSIQNNTEKKLDINRLNNFCTCQLNLVTSKKISDSLMQTLSNPNSLLFYEIMYTCGDPFSNAETLPGNWNKNFANDIKGPMMDTLNILNLNGMTYVKVKMGSMTQLWLFDTGASDLLINKEMETILRKENVLTDANYLGVGEYEMANGTIDSCRRYRVDNVGMGNFTINNIIVAVTESGKRIIVGKALLNKFRNWNLDNSNSTLMLWK